MVVVVIAADACDPDVALVPDQPPLAVQDVAFVLDHVRVVVLPDATLVADALNETVGVGATETATLWLSDPPMPVQVSVYVLFDVIPGSVFTAPPAAECSLTLNT